MRRQHTEVLKALWLLFKFILPTYTDEISDSIASYAQEEFNQQANEPHDQEILQPEYDFIIVGAGTAGCTLANRLTEVPEWKVLLVEVGAVEDFAMDIPLLVNYLQFTSANWGYKTAPSKRYCAGFVNGQCNWPRGKVIGGSSVLNYLIYTRGSRQDYMNWEAMGNDGWGWDDVLPYFKKTENFNIPDFDDPTYHGYEGHLNVEHAPFRTEKVKAWVSGAQELGFIYGDYNGATSAGVSFLQLSMKNGTRHSASRAYLHPIHSRINLHVSKETIVTKLIFDDTQTKVIGVELEKKSKIHKILAKKEVILSAGAINTPQLLMLSGIGPQEHLNSMRIPIVKNLRVGYNLMDHVAAGGLQFIVQDQNFSLSADYIMNHLNVAFDWMTTRQGPLTLPAGCEAAVFMDLKDKFNKSGWPDMELIFIGGGLNSDPIVPKMLGFDDKIYADTYGAMGKRDAFMVWPVLLHPKSKGRVMLQSRDPKTHPILIANYFQYPEDMRTILEGFRTAIEISKQTSMQNIGTKLYDVPIQECLKHGPFGSDEYFGCQAQMFSVTNYHLCGTCKMGLASDPTAVVDSRLKVHGIDKLRVIDASIMPQIISGHTNSPVYMIAEKGADLVKEDWGKL